MKKYLVFFVLILSSCKKDGTEFNTEQNAAKGDILFISRRIPNSADWQMFIVDVASKNQSIISDKLVRCAPPVPSHRGDKVAFTTYEDQNYNLYTVDKNGQNLTRLSTGKQYCGNPAWSPDDRTIVFVKNDHNTGGNYDIYRVDINGNNEVKLTDQNDNASPQFHPNGTTIVYTSFNNVFTGIYKMNTDGTGKQLLTPERKSFGSPVVSPDGSKIAITSIDRNGSQIFVMDADGGRLKQLTFSVSPEYHDTGFPREGSSNPAWSPNGQKIAYVSYENGSPDIFTIKPNGTGNKRLTNTPLRDEQPAWTKDGNHIIFSSNRDLTASAEIYIMTSEGKNQVSITNYTNDDIYPVALDK